MRPERALGVAGATLMLALFGCGGDGGGDERQARPGQRGDERQGTAPGKEPSPDRAAPAEPPSEAEIRRREEAGEKPVDDSRLERQVADALRAAYDRPSTGGFTLDLVTFIGALSGNVLIRADAPEGGDARTAAHGICDTVRRPSTSIQGLRSLSVVVGSYRTRC